MLNTTSTLTPSQTVDPLGIAMPVENMPFKPNRVEQFQKLLFWKMVNPICREPSPFLLAPDKGAVVHYCYLAVGRDYFQELLRIPHILKNTAAHHIIKRPGD